MSPNDRNLERPYSKNTITTTNTYNDIFTIDILDYSPDLKVLQLVNMYCKHICNSLHLLNVGGKFMTQDNILYKLAQEGDKTFKALIATKSLALTIMINMYNLQGNTGTVNTY